MAAFADDHLFAFGDLDLHSAADAKPPGLQSIRAVEMCIRDSRKVGFEHAAPDLAGISIESCWQINSDFEAAAFIDNAQYLRHCIRDWPIDVYKRQVQH